MTDNNEYERHGLLKHLCVKTIFPIAPRLSDFCVNNFKSTHFGTNIERQGTGPSFVLILTCIILLTRPIVNF